MVENSLARAAEYDEIKNSLTDISQRVKSLESQVNQLLTPPRNQQFHITVLYAISIGSLIVAVLGLILLLFKK